MQSDDLHQLPAAGTTARGENFSDTTVSPGAPRSGKPPVLYGPAASIPSRPVARIAPMPAPGGRRSMATVVRAAMVVMLIAGGIWLVRNHDLAADWLLTRTYHPPADISRIADADTMTPYARRLFYVNKPQVEPRADFNAHCSKIVEQASVLGCYAGNRRGIYVYNITEPQLNGIREVTAAHEMLHQAYDRLSAKERASLDGQLLAFAKTVTDQTLLDKMATYKKSEPAQLPNEYHSLFGTEVRTLPLALENYYKRYFARRSVVVDLRNRYQDAFTKRTQQIAAYDATLTTMKRQLEADKTALTGQETAIRAQRAQLDAYLAANEVAPYNAAVPGYNTQVQAYKALIAAANARIEQYNQIVQSRNAIALEEQQLQTAIDSHAVSVPR